MLTRVDSAAFWSRKAEGYENSKIKDLTAYRHTLSQTRSLLGSSDAVIELGCGTGTTAINLADAVDSYLATDTSGGMIGIAQAKAEKADVDGLTFATVDIAELDAVHVDRILAFNLLHLVADLDSYLAKVRDHLVPGGLFVSKTPCRPLDGGWSLGLRLMFMALPAMQLARLAPFVHLRRQNELERAIRQAGFEIVSAENHNESPPSRFIVAWRI
jgi:SAM-dependent methyltransferase